MVAPRPFTAYVATTRYYVKATDDESTLTPPAHRREGRGVQPDIWNVIGNDVRPASWSWEVQEGAPPVAPAAAKTPPPGPGVDRNPPAPGGVLLHYEYKMRVAEELVGGGGVDVDGVGVDFYYASAVYPTKN